MQPRFKFKVGDRVKIVATDKFGATAGRTGTITKIDLRPCVSFPYIITIDDNNTGIIPLTGGLFGEDELQTIDNALQRLKKRLQQK